MSWTVRRALLALTVVVAACGDGTSPPKPSAVVFVSAPPASSQVGAPLPSVTIVVKDEKGNAMSGQPLTITVNGGTLTGAPTSTQGTTSIGTWTLAGKVGTNTITITSGSLPALTASVQGTAGPPAKVTAASLAAASTVGKVLAVPIAVLDAFDNPVGGATVQLSISGGGSLAAGSAVADASGTATAQWTLGTTRGANTLTASVGSAVGNFTTVAQADVPAAVQILEGDAQTANAGSALPVAPRASVVDRFGNGTPRQNVTFSVTAGGGSLTGAATVATDTNGVVVGPTWVLGKRNIPQELTLSVGGVTRAIAATIKTNFSLILRFIGTTTDAQKAIFQGAAARITAAITQGGPPVIANAFPLDVACGITGVAPITETIAGIIIYAGIGPIDGPGKILAESGPCGFRSAASNFMPAVAVIQFDEADLASLTGGGSLEDVATHEMFHSLGYGAVWSALSLVTGTTADPRYSGSNGKVGCAMVAPATTCGTAVPLENTGGAGTVGAHWRESVFLNELMTGFLNSGANPLSVMSILSMLDLGYAVSPTAADPYSLTTALRAPASRQSTTEPWERLHFPTSPSELTPVGSLLMRPRKSP